MHVMLSVETMDVRHSRQQYVRQLRGGAWNGHVHQGQSVEAHLSLHMLSQHSTCQDEVHPIQHFRRRATFL